MQKLELLQCLDIIDIEGAYKYIYHHQVYSLLIIIIIIIIKCRVFQRLERLSIDKENALSLIRDYYYPLDPWIFDIAYIIRNNDNHINSNSTNNEYAELLLLLASLKIDNNTDHENRKRLYNQAISIVDNLNTDKW